MPSPAANAPYTWDDFIALEEDDLRELIDGELVEVEVPNWRHERIVAMLCFFLTEWAEAGHGGRAIASGYKVRISDASGRDAGCPVLRARQRRRERSGRRPRSGPSGPSRRGRVPVESKIRKDTIG